MFQEGGAKMKSYLYILGLLAVIIVAGCTYAAQETGKSAEAVNEIVTEDSTTDVSEAPKDNDVGAAEGTTETETDATATDVNPETVQGVVGAQPEVKEFTMTAKRWEFEPEVIRVNEGDTVRLFIKSIDVAHGFAVPDFGVNERLNPGQTVKVEFVADKTGIFTFFCSVQCGSGHSSMNGQLIVE